MSSARIVGAVVPVMLLLIALAGALWVRRQERRERSSYLRRPGVLADWHAMSTDAQRAHDNAALDAAEAAEHTTARMAEAAKRNALFHP